MFKASDCGLLGRQAADHPWSALRVVNSCRKDCPTAKVLLEAKAAALHPKTVPELKKRRGEEAQAIGLASQLDRQRSDRWIGDT